MPLFHVFYVFLCFFMVFYIFYVFWCFSWFLNVLTCFGALKTSFIYLWRHQNTLKNIRKYMRTSWENIIYGNMRLNKFENFRKLNSHFVEFIFCIYYLYEFLNIYLEIILRWWGAENYTFSITKQHPNLNLNFIYVKKTWTGFYSKLCVFKECTLNF